MRRIIEGLLRDAGGDPQPTLESNSMIVLLLPRPHRTLGKRDAGAARCDTRPHRCAARDPDREAGSNATPIGLVVPARQPMTP